MEEDAGKNVWIEFTEEFDVRVSTSVFFFFFANISSSSAGRESYEQEVCDGGLSEFGWRS